MGVMQAFNDDDDKNQFKNIQDLFEMAKNVVGQELCEAHNKTYNLIETPGGIVGSCPDCFKEQLKKEDEKLIEKAMENKEGWQHSYINRLERVSSDLKEARVNTYHPKEKTQEQAKRMTIDYVNSFNKEKSLVLSGKPGNGKSHLSYAITKVLRQRGYKTWFIKTTELLDLIKSTYQNGSQLTEERIFELIESIDLLVLDDVGSEYIKLNESGHESWSSDTLYKTFDLRLNKSIVCTTNYTEQELEKKYGYNGERIVSRMMDNAKGVRLQGEDHRRKRKNRF